MKLEGLFLHSENNLTMYSYVCMYCVYPMNINGTYYLAIIKIKKGSSKSVCSRSGKAVWSRSRAVGSFMESEEGGEWEEEEGSERQKQKHAWSQAWRNGDAGLCWTLGCMTCSRRTIQSHTALNREPPRWPSQSSVASHAAFSPPPHSYSTLIISDSAEVLLFPVPLFSLLPQSCSSLCSQPSLLTSSHTQPSLSALFSPVKNL